MAGKFASDTSVSSERSRSEMERTLMRYGADQFMYATSSERAVVGFRCNGRMVKFMLPMPDSNNPEFTHSNHRNPQLRTQTQRMDAWEQACRQRWRALNLVVKAKLEAVESGITDFDSEFLAHLVLPNGETVGQSALPAIALAYDTGRMPTLLPMLSGPNA